VTSASESKAGVKILRKIRSISEREIAINLVLELAESGLRRFSLLQAYDDDAQFVDDLARRLNVVLDKAFDAKLTRVVRKLVNAGALESMMSSTHKEYIGEPTKQRDYWLPPGKARLLTVGATDHTGAPEWEAAYLIRRAYPILYGDE